MAVDVVQKIIHRLEVGGGLRFLRIGLSVLVLLLVVVIYNWRGYRNLASLEAMDSAQLARNIAQGKGYTTLFVRPLSIYLLSKHSDSQLDTTPGELGAAASPQPSPVLTDPACLKGMHPDLANPPVYPLVLAGLMKLADLTKLVPLDYTIPARLGPFWGNAGHFWWHPPDFFIAVFNQFLFLAVVGLTFLLARRLFNPSIAWVSALVLLGTELFWRFSVSGLSTMLLLLVFMGLVWCLTLLEAETREPRWGLAGFFVFAALAGLLVGLGSLTRYSFAWLILPVGFFVIWLAERRQRILVAVITFVAFASVLTPWVVRNYSVSGEPFGTASFAFLETTQTFPGHRLERSLEPELNQSASLQKLVVNVRSKLIANLRQIIATDLPKLSGTWVSAFFLAGLLIGSPNPAVKRLRVFLVASLVVLVFVQALGHTQLSEDSPEINSENLLVLLGPLVLVFGVSFFFLLLEQIDFPFRELRYVAFGVFGLIVCLPLLLTFLQLRATPFAYPPYYPPQIQSATDWTKEDELMMSDIPWAVAWYGQRQCAWLTLNFEKDFFTINDVRKPVQAIFITHVPAEDRILMLRQWLLGGDQGWGQFMVAYIGSANAGLPGGVRSFPLNFLQDREEDTKRWRGERFLLTYRDRPVKSP